jgi:HlyD family secretion protein
MIALGVIVIVSVIGAAGYLGYRNAQSRQTPVQQAPTTVAVTRGDVEKTVSAPGQLVNTRRTVLSMDENGRLTNINVRPGDSITAGEILADLDPTNLRATADRTYASFLVAQAEYSQTVQAPSSADVASARRDLSSAQAAYSDLFKPPSDSTVAGLRAALQNAQATVQRAQSDYDRAYRANPAGIGGAPEGLALQKATNDFEAAKASYDAAFQQPKSGDVQAALARIADAKAKLAALSPSSSAMELAKTKLDQARLTWQQAEADAQKTTLVAPSNGIVTEVKVNPGDTVQAGQEVLMLTDPKGVEVQSTVAEEDLPYVRQGQAVQVYFDALPDAAVTGHVRSIVPVRTADAQPLYPVNITIDHLPAGLAPGMTVDGSIVISQTTNVLRLPRALVQAGAGNTAQVEVWANGVRENHPVKVGLRGDTYVEIVSGLQEGELVVGQ